MIRRSSGNDTLISGGTNLPYFRNDNKSAAPPHSSSLPFTFSLDSTMTMLQPFETAQISPDLKLAYIDSFSLLTPEERPKKYKTILAIHGVGFNSGKLSPPVIAHPKTANRRCLESSYFHSLDSVSPTANPLASLQSTIIYRVLNSLRVEGERRSGRNCSLSGGFLAIRRMECERAGSDE